MINFCNFQIHLFTVHPGTTSTTSTFEIIKLDEFGQILINF